MVGSKYWAVGIILRCHHGEWAARVEFCDEGFCQNESTEGHLTTRYFVPIEVAIDTILEDARRLGIELRTTLFAEGDGEDKDWPMPDGWREILQEQARRIGWETYS